MTEPFLTTENCLVPGCSEPISSSDTGTSICCNKPIHENSKSTELWVILLFHNKQCLQETLYWNIILNSQRILCRMWRLFGRYWREIFYRRKSLQPECHCNSLQWCWRDCEHTPTSHLRRNPIFRYQWHHQFDSTSPGVYANWRTNPTSIGECCSTKPGTNCERIFGINLCIYVIQIFCIYTLKSLHNLSHSTNQDERHWRGECP